MKNDSAEFLVKTNNDVDEWMDSFYTEGRKHESRLHCQWAWQENERRHRAFEAELLESLDELANGYAGNAWDVGLVPRLKKARAAIAKAKGEA